MSPFRKKEVATRCVSQDTMPSILYGEQTNSSKDSRPLANSSGGVLLHQPEGLPTTQVPNFSVEFLLIRASS